MPVVTVITPFEMTTIQSAIFPILAGAFSGATTVTSRVPSTAIKDLKIPFYTFVLAGQSSITIPISSFQARFNDGGPGYLSVVIPGVEYADEITARADAAKMQVFKHYRNGAGVTVKSEIIADVILDDIRIDEGARKKSISLSGHKDRAWGSKAVTLTEVVSRNELNDRVTLKFAEPDIDLRPGDVLTAGSDVITVEQVRFTVGPDYQSMVVVEAEA